MGPRLWCSLGWTRTTRRSPIRFATWSPTRAGMPITVEMGGASEVFREIQETVETDLLRAESIAFPITLALLVLVFGSLVAATLCLSWWAVSPSSAPSSPSR